jgi:hypothetical protein
MSWICVAGRHWACANCCPNMVCDRHTRRKLLPTGNLWFKTAHLERVCHRGCVARPGSGPHTCTRTSFWAGSFGLITDISTVAAAFGRILGGAPPFAAAVHINRTGCELVCLAPGETSMEVSGMVRLGGFVDLVPVHVFIPRHAEVGDAVKMTCMVDLGACWPNIKVVSTTFKRVNVWDSHPCAKRRYWRHRGERRAPAPDGDDIVWHVGPAILPPPEAAGHFASEANGVVCAWCNTAHTNLTTFLEKCAPDSDGTTW